MANFDVITRRDYRDVQGLLLDARAENILEDSASPGIFGAWKNTAPIVKAGDPRFGDIVTGATPPTVVPGVSATFTKASSQALQAGLTATIAPTEAWAMAFKAAKGGSAVDPQAVFGGKNDDLIAYRRSGGDVGYRHNGTLEVGGGTGDMVDAQHLLVFDGAGGLDWYEDGVLLFSDTVTTIGFNADGSSSILIGRSLAGEFFDGVLNSLQIWGRNISPKERDFIFASVDPATDHSASVRAQMVLRQWNDDTADPSEPREYDRLNPEPGISHLYILARSAGPLPANPVVVQFACEIGGVVLPDSGLGGDLFEMSFVETALNSLPVVTQDAGFSAVFDVQLTREGHYTFLFTRDGGTYRGGRVVHIDLEEGP